MSISTRLVAALVCSIAATATPLIACSTLVVAGSPQPTQVAADSPEPIEAVAEVALDDALPDLVVNGEVISAAAVRRELAYRLGRRQIDTRKLAIFLDREIERQGLTKDDFDVDADVDTVIESGRQNMKKEFGDRLTEEQILANNKLDVTSWRDQTRLALLFNRVFLPENPENWPPATVDALASALGGEERETFMQQMIDGFKKRKADGNTGSETSQQQLMFNMMLRGPIMQSLQESSDIKTAQDGIPAELVMTIDGAEIRTDDVFAEIEKNLAPIEWQRTRLWLAKSAAMRHSLEKLGAYLDKDAFQAIWDELEGKHKDTIFPIEQVVMTFKKFPSMSAYKSFYRGLQSYRELIKDEINDENLTKHLDRINRLMGLEQVDAEVILLSAFDYTLSSWKENGWETAKERAIKVSRELAGGADWDELLMENSDYWDPPVPASKQGEAATGSRRNRGKFGPKNRNTLLQMVDENEFEIFLTGSSVGDTIFFDIETDTYGGPYKGVHGYYIAKVKSRIPANKSYTLDDPGQRESIELDYLQVRFTQFAAKAMAEAEIQGL